MLVPQQRAERLARVEPVVPPPEEPPRARRGGPAERRERVERGGHRAERRRERVLWDVGVGEDERAHPRGHGAAPAAVLVLVFLLVAFRPGSLFDVCLEGAEERRL